MAALRVGIQLSSLKMPLKKGILAAAQMGASAVEIDALGPLRPRDFSQTALRHLRRMLSDLNLNVCAVGFHTRRGYEVVDELERRIEATKEALTFARALGAPIVINHVGQIPEDENSSPWAAMLTAICEIGRFADKAGAMLAAQTGEDGAHDLRRLLDALPNGALLVDLDPGRLLAGRYSPIEAIAELRSYIVHVHATDAVQERAQGPGTETALGRGSVDYPELLASLEEIAYRGVFTIARQQSDNPVSEIGAAVKYLQSMFAL